MAYGLRCGVIITTLVLVPLAVDSPGQQRTVTAADIQQLQDGVLDATTDVARLRVRDPVQAAQIERELDEVRDDVVYLRAKLRREGMVSQGEYDGVRDRLTALRQRARSGLTGVIASAPVAGPNEVPVGAEIDIRLQSELSSKTATIEDRFEATTVLNLDNAERILIPAGSVVRGIVSAVNRAGRVDRTGRLTLSLDQITVRGENYPVRGVVIQALEGEGIRGEAGRVGAGAGVGAVIGGILGGFKGVLTGILVGAGGTIAATRGNDVTMPAGTILRVRLDTPLTVK
jgi:hypothetical protein